MRIVLVSLRYFQQEIWMQDKPKTEQLFEDLTALVKQKTNGERFMSVRRIMQEFSVSQFTVDQALKKMEENGAIYREPGKGIFVRDQAQVTSKRLGLVLPDWPSPLQNELEEMMKLEGEKHGVQVVRRSYAPCSDIWNFLPAKEFDALAVISDNATLSPEILHKFTSVSVPVVLVGLPLRDVHMNWVSGDPLAQGAMAASYLIKNGHSQLAVLISEPDSSVISRRVEGFAMVAEINGYTCKTIDCNVKLGQYTPEVAYETLTKYLQTGSGDFTGLYVVSDETALAAMRALIDCGCQVPATVSVIGSDGLRQGAYFHPPLTSVGTSYREMAAEIIKSALDCWSNGEAVRGKLIKPYVIERDSVKDIR
jgi:DNA-binding LacI/PurR family transcriptional regulator